jgi:hypothetical protein
MANNMHDDFSLLENIRSRIENEFISFASREGIDLEFNRDKRTLNICSRLYDSTFQGRRVNIDYNPESSLKIDSFVKEFESEVGFTMLLTISVNGSGLHADQLWRACKDWLYERKDADAVLFS